MKSLPKCARIGALAVCVLALFSAGLWAEDGEPRVKLKIRILDMGKLFDSLDEFQAYQARMTEKQKQVAQVQRRMRREIEVLETAMKQLRAGTEERAAKQDELYRKRQEYNLKMKQYQKQMERTNSAFLEDIYRKVLTTVREYAKINEIDFVLKMRRIELEDEVTPLRMQVELNPIIYAGEKADITEDIAAVLNRKYKQAEGK